MGIGAQNLLKKHQVLMGEIASHEPDDKIEDLQLQWKELVAKGDIRKTDLEDALKTHQYTADCVEAETWMNEKEPLVSNTDYGKDEDSAQAMLMKHEALMADIDTFNTVIHNLREQSQDCKPLLLGDISDKEVVEALNDYEE